MRVLTGAEKQLFLGSPIFDGGEAEIFAHPSDYTKLIKVYKEGKCQSDKIPFLCSHPPAWFDVNAPTVAWPLDTVRSHSTKEPVGCVIPRVVDSISLEELGNPNTRHPKISISFLILVARNIARRVGALHDAGFIVGDVHPGNILVSRSGEVVLIDMDSVQAKKKDGTIFHCNVGVPKYQPPEYQQASYHELERTKWADCWAVTVLIFELLLGDHPFDARYTGDADQPPELSDLIEQGIWPWSGSFSDHRPPHGAADFEGVPDEIKALFFDTFEDGCTDPDKRASLKEWVSVLSDPTLSTRPLPTRRVWKDQLDLVSESDSELPPVWRDWRYLAGLAMSKTGMASATAVLVLFLSLVTWRGFSQRVDDSSRKLLESDLSLSPTSFDPYHAVVFEVIREDLNRPGETPSLIQELIDEP